MEENILRASCLGGGILLTLRGSQAGVSLRFEKRKPRCLASSGQREFSQNTGWSSTLEPTSFKYLCVCVLCLLFCLVLRIWGASVIFCGYVPFWAFEGKICFRPGFWRSGPWAVAIYSLPVNITGLLIWMLPEDSSYSICHRSTLLSRYCIHSFVLSTGTGWEVGTDEHFLGPGVLCTLAHKGPTVLWGMFPKSFLKVRKLRFKNIKGIIYDHTVISWSPWL